MRAVWSCGQRSRPSATSAAERTTEPSPRATVGLSAAVCVFPPPPCGIGGGVGFPPSSLWNRRGVCLLLLCGGSFPLYSSCSDHLQPGCVRLQHLWIKVPLFFILPFSGEAAICLRLQRTRAGFRPASVERYIWTVSFILLPAVFFIFHGPLKCHSDKYYFLKQTLKSVWTCWIQTVSKQLLFLFTLNCCGHWVNILSY